MELIAQISSALTDLPVNHFECFSFAQMMELLAQGIADGVIQVPKEQ
ncbi:Unknown protein sequence [Pseudomonas syringae pv. spinaceae]|uniref:Uncharacterized protein n=1 Tax=Pseudomonas syringae pv. spinaceae TaxID=264459 RepID=A0A0Q0DKU5_PSESX|nr:Unknown protein sequence [Pseudomonas syringae pv. spinaceae]